MFQIVGSLCGGGPIVRKMQVGETVYEGQLLQSGRVGGAGGHVQVADAASEALENDQPIIGVVMGVESEDRTYDSTYRGYKCTYTTTQATVASTGTPTVNVGIIVPGVTLLKAPLNVSAYGTALSVLTESSGSSGGTVVTHAATAVTDTADDLCTVYCRTGANRGQYRIVTTGATGSQTVTVPFPYAIAIGDTFVKGACVLGPAAMDIISTANAIEGDAALSSYYVVFFHEINLEEAGKEYAIFTVQPKSMQGIAV